ncbi:hypothetical protein [Niveispirillum sp. KHB5.9]|uniref:hypothetical protein n=1 Tax=Niveispirillum sp. KHB5.9 TaxID=3400269 RepID=UPI003A88A768
MSDTQAGAPPAPRTPRLLVTIPHYYRQGSNSRYGSGRDKAEARIHGLRRCITALHQSLGSRHAIIQISTETAHPIIPQQGVEIDIVICTAGEDHLIGELALGDDLFTHEPTDIPDPMFLGFECHRVLKERFGAYDWYAFMEDDLVISDPWFLVKCAWFQKYCGPMKVLQPNRFEVAGGPPQKVYIDGDLKEGMVRQILPNGPEAELKGHFLDLEIRMVRALNPHSGMFMLSSVQMQHWLQQPRFLNRDSSFLGPLESAATCGILRTFQVFKPHVGNAAFLEVQHYGHAFMRHIGGKFPWRDDPVI